MLLNELMCIADFMVFAFYAIVIYKLSVQNIDTGDKPIALLRSKVRVSVCNASNMNTESTDGAD
jgi:hypothetical protein